MPVASAQDQFSKKYEKFISEINVLLMQSMNNQTDMFKKFDIFRKDLKKHHNKLKDNSIKVEELESLVQSERELKANNFICTGSLVYLFALFEQFLISSVSIFAKSKLKRGDAYFNVYKSIAKKRNSEGDDRLLNAGLFEKHKALDFINELPIFDIAVLMFSFDKKLNFNLFAKFVELRERRNLLMHRGNEFDSRYFDVLSKVLNSRGKALDKILSNVLQSVTEENIKPEMSAHANILYLRHAHETVFELATSFYLDTLKLKKNGKKTSVLPGNITHDMMKMFLINDKFPAHLAVQPILQSGFNTKIGWENIDDLDLANLLILGNFFHFNFPDENPETNNEPPGINTYLPEKIKDQNIRELVQHFIANNDYQLKEKMLSYANKTDTDLDQLNSWFLTKAYDLKF